ncbi:MAG TPA: hypothetical protein VFS40_15975 [Gemmatimonadales bacterium]|nr:hypothetical protein [Gemmatimonadales bacterium]
MRLAVVAVVCSAVAFAAGCGDGGPSGGLGAADINGTWDLNVSGSCLRGSLPVRLTATAGGALTSATNAWTNNEADLGFFRPLDGSVDLESGAAEFHMWGSGDRTHALLFTGTLGADGSLDGTITDPMPGAGPVFHFSGGPTCTAAATGHKR